MRELFICFTAFLPMLFVWCTCVRSPPLSDWWQWWPMYWFRIQITFFLFFFFVDRKFSCGFLLVFILYISSLLALWRYYYVYPNTSNHWIKRKKNWKITRPTHSILVATLFLYFLFYLLHCRFFDIEHIEIECLFGLFFSLNRFVNIGSASNGCDTFHA